MQTMPIPMKTTTAPLNPENSNLRKRTDPAIIVDSKSNRTFLRGDYIGKGGFAKCYKFTDNKSKRVYAAKIIPKKSLRKKRQQEKLCSEIEIHRAMKHENIVEFHDVFEDRHFVYILLELCENKSLMDLHRSRKRLSEPETQFFMKQLIAACQYLRKRKVIHRDLKLGNVFLDDGCNVKLGDFGLAAQLKSDDETRGTLCGTPNYIAPEILNRKGHGYPVDIWSLGVILYTLLVGKPPFETKELSTTYSRIRNNQFSFPSNISISAEAKHLIQSILVADPNLRPSLDDIIGHRFFSKEPFKQFHQLPVWILRTSPLYLDNGTAVPSDGQPGPMYVHKQNPMITLKSNGLTNNQFIRPMATDTTEQIVKPKDTRPSRVLKSFKSPSHLGGFHRKPMETSPVSPAPKSTVQPLAVSLPIVRVKAWVNLAQHYGLGYVLTNGVYGAYFNDFTRLSAVLIPNKKSTTGEPVWYCQYIPYTCSKSGTAPEPKYFYSESYPVSLKKKISLLRYFKAYMFSSQSRNKFDDLEIQLPGRPVEDSMSYVQPRTLENGITMMPHVKKWKISDTTIAFRLSNKSFQVNFFADHTKIILSTLQENMKRTRKHPSSCYITYFDTNRQWTQYWLNDISSKGLPEEHPLLVGLTVTKDILKRF